MNNQSQVLKIWVVEDDEWYREFLRYTISLIPEYDVKVFSTGKAMLDHLHEKPDVITLDFKLPDLDGGALLKKISDFDPDIQVLIISEQEKVDTALELLKAGAYDYLVKSNDLRDKLLNTLRNLGQNRSLKTRLVNLEQEVTRKYDFNKRLIGNSDAMQKIFSLISKATQSNINVTITGETGTGKEEVAKAIHYNSSQRKGPFVTVNMAAIPHELAESELFGHEKGAFTGATYSRIGRFEESVDGTIFLDEIGDLDLALQAKLLRVLQEKEVTRIGSNKIIKINCRVMVATHRDLLDEVKQKHFREDLYYRLLGLIIHLPPLRERGNDILLLSKHFIEKFCTENNMVLKKLSTSAQEKLLQYSFPGNVRELKSVIELAAVMSNNSEIEAEDILLQRNNTVPLADEKELTLDEYNRRIIHHYLEKFDHNITLVATKLGIGKSTIYRLLKNEEEKSTGEEEQQ